MEDNPQTDHTIDAKMDTSNVSPIPTAKQPPVKKRMVKPRLATAASAEDTAAVKKPLRKPRVATANRAENTAGATPKIATAVRKPRTPNVPKSTTTRKPRTPKITPAASTAKPIARPRIPRKIKTVETKNDVATNTTLNSAALSSDKNTKKLDKKNLKKLKKMSDKIKEKERKAKDKQKEKEKKAKKKKKEKAKKEKAKKKLKEKKAKKKKADKKKKSNKNK